MAVIDSYGDHDLVIREADDMERMTIGFNIYCRNCRWEVHAQASFDEDNWEKLRKLVTERLLFDFKRQVPISCLDAQDQILVEKIMEL